MPGGKGPSGSDGAGKGGASGVGSCKASDYSGGGSGAAGGYGGGGAGGCHFSHVSPGGVKVGRTDSGMSCMEVGGGGHRESCGGGGPTSSTMFSACGGGAVAGAARGLFMSGPSAAVGAARGAVVGCVTGIAGLFVKHEIETRQCIAKMEEQFSVEQLRGKTSAESYARLSEMTTFIYGIENSVHLPKSEYVSFSPAGGIEVHGAVKGYYNQYVANIKTHTTDGPAVAAAEAQMANIGTCRIL